MGVPVSDGAEWAQWVLLAALLVVTVVRIAINLDDRPSGSSNGKSTRRTER